MGLSKGTPCLGFTQMLNARSNVTTTKMRGGCSDGGDVGCSTSKELCVCKHSPQEEVLAEGRDSAGGSSSPAH